MRRPFAIIKELSSVICTIVGNREDNTFRNFICTSTDPHQGWSQPIWLPEDLGNIDPDLFFDDDGAIYLTLCAVALQVMVGPERGSVIYRLDPNTCNPSKAPTSSDYNGCLRPQMSPEAPHIFKRDGWYYLFLAESGTGWSHAVTVARSQMFWGLICLGVLTHSSPIVIWAQLLRSLVLVTLILLRMPMAIGGRSAWLIAPANMVLTWAVKHF